MHFGLFGGISNYQGDLVDQFYDFRQTGGALGLNLYYELTDKWMIRGGLSFAKVTGADKYSKNKTLIPRNLSFQSAITEASLVGEYYLYNLNDRRVSPYIFGGLGVFHFNPYTYDGSSQRIFLQPLGTEGQGLPSQPDRKQYGLVQLSVPVGGGLKFALTENIRIGAEIGLRKLFTDYLDDVSTTYADESELLAARGQQAVDLAYRGDELSDGSPLYPTKGDQRGGAEFKDMYYFSGITISFRLGTGKKGGFGNRRGTGCPANPM